MYRKLTLKIVCRKRKGHYCISQEGASLPNLLKFNISAQLGSRQEQKSHLALSFLTTLAENEVTFSKPMAISRGLAKAHFNWKTKFKFAMKILNWVLKFDSRELYQKLCNWRFGLVKHELSCLYLRDKRTWQKHNS